jgi:hypothetical protein
MKTIFCLSLISLSFGALAQTAANNNSSSSTTTSAQGNSQAVTFTSPGTVTTTQNLNTSGTSRNIVEYTGDYTIKNVPSVTGPNLTTSNDTCMGSTSGGANGAGFGVSFGSTWTDEHCKRLKMSRELWNKGMKAASLAMDCMDAGAKAALEMTGTKCPQSMTVAERREAFGAQASATGAPEVPGPAFAAVPAPAGTDYSAVSTPVTLRQVNPAEASFTR